MKKKECYFFLIGSLKMGGTERNAAVIGKELLNRGYDVRFIVYKKIFDLADEQILKQVLILNNGGFKNKYLQLLIIWLDLIRQLIVYRPFRLVSFSTGSNILAFATLYPAIIFTIDTNIFYFKSRLYRRYLQKYLSIFPNVRKVIVPSDGLRAAIIDYFIASKKVIRLYNPVDLEAVRNSGPESIGEFTFLQPGKYIITAGRLVPGKRIEHLIDLLNQSEILKRYPLVILGTGRLKPVLEKHIEALQLSDRVHLLGFQSNPYRFFSKARFFILNSEFESFANVLIEALACGTPVLSNDCDFGPREIIQKGVNGFLYKKENTDNFRQAVSQLMDDSVYENVAMNCADSVKRFDNKLIADNWELILSRHNQTTQTR